LSPLYDDKDQGDEEEGEISNEVFGGEHRKKKGFEFVQNVENIQSFSIFSGWASRHAAVGTEIRFFFVRKQKAI
jgi:hypothetical protein